MTLAKKVEFLVWEKRREEIERNPVSDELWSASVDVLDSYEREVFISSLWRLDLSCNSVTGLERMLLDLIL